MLEPEDRDPSVVIDKQSDNPILRAYPGTSYVGSDSDPLPPGPAINLQDRPAPTGYASTCTDPNIEGGINVIGGSTQSDIGIPVQTYYAKANVYGDPINDIHEDIGDLSTTDEIGNEAACSTAGDYIVFAGGQINGTSTDRIFVCDRSNGGVSWSELTSTLPSPIHAIGSVSYNGEVYLFGGNDDGFNNQDTVVKIDPVNDTVTSLTALPTPIAFADVVEVDGSAYIAGSIQDAGLKGTLYRYDLDSDTYTALSKWSNGGSDGVPSDSAFGAGTLVEYNKNIVYLDGFNFFNYNAIAYYDIEEDVWSSRDIYQAPGTGDEGASLETTGQKKGILVDDVVYIPGTGAVNGSTFAFVPEKDPFDE